MCSPSGTTSETLLYGRSEEDRYTDARLKWNSMDRRVSSRLPASIAFQKVARLKPPEADGWRDTWHSLLRGASAVKAAERRIETLTTKKDLERLSSFLDETDRTRSRTKDVAPGCEILDGYRGLRSGQPATHDRSSELIEYGEGFIGMH